jgi:alpha-1,3-rhamnosyl/mannosyltransferase
LPERFILYVGTNEPRKNVRGLLEAYSLLPEKAKKEHPLVLAGPRGWEKRDLFKRVQAMERQGLVKELGYVPEASLGPLMKAATLLCFPSLYEGFGLPPLEAAACGTPVVCSNGASLPEVMGEAAVYVDPRRPEDIARGLLSVLEDEALRDALKQRGPERAARFTWEKCAAQTIEVYHAAR